MKKWQNFLVGLGGCLWALFCFAQTQTITLSKIQYESQSQFWQIYFNAPANIKVHQFFLTNPSRLVLDISNAHSAKTDLIKLDPKMPIKNIRSSKRPDQSLRIVLDLKKEVAPRTLKIIFNKPKVTEIKATPTKIPREIIVVIDPGHGGKDPGATGLNKTYEKDIVLQIAKKLQILINQQPGFKALLTRKGDYYLSLRERLSIARQNKADMFISIHADAYPDPLAHGFSVFALSQRGATSEAARWLAARENQSELMGGVDLSDKEDALRSVLINLSQTAAIQTSLAIGQNLLDNVRPFAYLHHKHVEQAAFVVLKSPDIPSLLVETGFLSNSREENKLRTHSYQYNLAHSMMLGIKGYFIHKPPKGTWLAAQDSRSRNG